MTAAEMAGLSICNDPLPQKRLIEGVYEQIFKELKPGNAIKCPKEKVNSIASGLRIYIEKIGKAGVLSVKSVGNYGDGMGRVWMLEKEKAK